jgi:hypothetical protein
VTRWWRQRKTRKTLERIERQREADTDSGRTARIVRAIEQCQRDAVRCERRYHELEEELQNTLVLARRAYRDAWARGRDDLGAPR